MKTANLMEVKCTPHTTDDENDAIRAQVEAEMPRPVGGFENDDAADAHRAKQDARFLELCGAHPLTPTIRMAYALGSLSARTGTPPNHP